MILSLSVFLFWSRFSDEFRMYYFLFLFFFMYFLPLLFIGATCFSITRALMRKIPIQPRRDPRAITLEHGRRKVGNTLSPTLHLLSSGKRLRYILYFSRNSIHMQYPCHGLFLCIDNTHASTCYNEVEYLHKTCTASFMLHIYS